jgi:hypothetical protein|tara:strand:+ start:345 stop:617 length:273 start_codon:yes stop_codon:yes gene_type:complete
MQVGDTVTVVTISGEYVGELEHFEDATVVLKKPRMVVQTEKGMGFAHGVAVTGKENPEQVKFLNVVYVIPTNEQVCKAWVEATTNIQLVK